MDMKSKNNFKHYFVDSKHTDDDFFQFNFELSGHKFEFTSCDDIFSKNEIDEGSLVLIKTLLKDKENFSGRQPHCGNTDRRPLRRLCLSRVERVVD